MLKLSSSTLRKAAEIQEEIEKLDVELGNLLTGISGPQDRPEKKPFVTRRPGRRVGKHTRSKNTRRIGVATGVRQILQGHAKPMKVAEIYRRLQAAGYAFRSSNPKNSLTAQMYRMRGVRRTGPGEFAAQ